MAHNNIFLFPSFHPDHMANILIYVIRFGHGERGRPQSERGGNKENRTEDGKRGRNRERKSERMEVRETQKRGR